MVKKDQTDPTKKKQLDSDNTNTTTTPVNTTDDTSINNINDDSCNTTVDGNYQTEDGGKSKEFNFSKNTFNQENGLAIEISADSEVSVNTRLKVQ